MRLQLDLVDRRNRLRAVPIVLHDHVIDHLLAVEPNAHAVADHPDEESIPMAQFIVGHMRRFALVDLVVVQAAGTHLCAHVTARRVPNLHLRGTAQINTRIGLLTVGIEPPIDIHFEIAVLFLGANIVVTVAHKAQQSVGDLPVTAHRFVSNLLFGGQFLRAHLRTFDRIFDQSFPTGEIFAVEHRHEASFFWHRCDVLVGLLNLVALVGIGAHGHRFFQQVGDYRTVKVLAGQRRIVNDVHGGLLHGGIGTVQIISCQHHSLQGPGVAHLFQYRRLAGRCRSNVHRLGQHDLLEFGRCAGRGHTADKAVQRLAGISGIAGFSNFVEFIRRPQSFPGKQRRQRLLFGRSIAGFESVGDNLQRFR